MLHLGGCLRQYDRVAVSDDGGRRFEEQEWPLGNHVAEFFGMLEIVSSDAHDLGWTWIQWLRHDAPSLRCCGPVKCSNVGPAEFAAFAPPWRASPAGS